MLRVWVWNDELGVLDAMKAGADGYLELPPSGGRFVAWESSRVIVLDSRVIHGAAAGPIQAGGERPGG